VQEADATADETTGLLETGRRNESLPLPPPSPGAAPLIKTTVLQPSPHASPAAPVLAIHALTLSTPDGKRTLIRDLSLSVPPSKHLLVVGNSGAGKSSLLRAIAGLWRTGTGEIERGPLGSIFFLPQKPYCPLGTLRDQLLYPTVNATGAYSNSELLDVLDAADLPLLAGRAGDGDKEAGLDAVRDWGAVLSLGEQQRLSFARLLVNKPALAICDEATSALDLVSERKM
jgi:ABC-type uncharacterized transport system fused permease/ATPase subunit